MDKFWKNFDIRFTKKETAALWMLFFTIMLSVQFFDGLLKTQIAEKAVTEKQMLFDASNPFRSLSLLAHSVFVYDLKKNQILFQKNSERSVPIASITKLMTTAVALDILDENEIITVSKEAISQNGSSSIRLGERWKLGDLIKVMLIESSNDGAYAIAEAAGMNIPGEDAPVSKFVAKMNEKAIKIGMSKSFFYNPSGLDENKEKAGAYASAQDVAKLISYVADNYAKYSEATEAPTYEIESESHIKHIVKNTNKSIMHLPGLLTSKTGYTRQAGGNLAIIAEPEEGERFAVVVLGSTVSGRFDDTVSLVDGALRYHELLARFNIEDRKEL